MCGGEEVEKAGGNLSKEQTKKERLVIAQNDLAEYSVNRSALGTLSEHAYWEMTGWLIAGTTTCQEPPEFDTVAAQRHIARHDLPLPASSGSPDFILWSFLL